MTPSTFYHTIFIYNYGQHYEAQDIQNARFQKCIEFEAKKRPEAANVRKCLETFERTICL